jgi:hypothetical protein
VDGFLAEYAVAPANILWRNSDRAMRWDLAALQESLGNSVYTVAVADVKAKDVAVFGLGPTGLNAIAVAKAMGAAQIIAVAGTAKHSELAKRMGTRTAPAPLCWCRCVGVAAVACCADVPHLRCAASLPACTGATHVVDRHEAKASGGVVECVRRLSRSGVGVHVALEMSGAGEALDQCLDCTATTGVVAVLGLYSAPVTIDWSKRIVLKDLTVRGVYGRRIWDTWKTTAQLLADGLDISPVRCPPALCSRALLPTSILTCACAACSVHAAARVFAGDHSPFQWHLKVRGGSQSHESGRLWQMRILPARISARNGPQHRRADAQSQRRRCRRRCSTGRGQEIGTYSLILDICIFIRCVRLGPTWPA